MGAGSSAIVMTALLISGYLFNLIFHPFRFFSNRAEGQKLFFMAAGTGLILGAFVFLAAGILRPSLDSGAWILRAAHVVDRAIPVPHACKLIAMILGSIVSASLLNLFSVILVGGQRSKPHVSNILHQRGRAQCVYDRLTEQFGSPMAQLLRRAVDEQKLVMVTLKSRKIYCGRVFEVPSRIDLPESCIELLPTFSSFRDKDTLRMGERTEYPVVDIWVARQRAYTLEKQIEMFDANVHKEVPARLSQSPQGSKYIRRVRRGLQKQYDEAERLVRHLMGGRSLDVGDWIKVLPVKEIDSLSFFDSGAYKDWFAKPSVDSGPVED